MTKAKDKSSTPASFGGVASWDGTAGSSSRYQPKSTSKPKELTEKEIAARRAEGKKLLKILGGELSGWYSAKRLWTGKDPVTGETANRWFAAGELGLDLASYVILFAKAGKAIKAAQTAGKVIDTLDNVSDASKALKAVDTVDDTKDALKVAEAADTVDDVGDSSKIIEGVDSRKKIVERIPKEVDDVIDYARSHNGAAQDGYKGNRIYNNIPKNPGDQKLPDGPIYREYDIYPNIKGRARGAERIIIGDDESVWYTDNHYKSFTRIR